MIARIDSLTTPPVVGRFYLVPTVRGLWGSSLRDWPVIGAKHNDATCIGFKADHYHLDWRFASSDDELLLAIAGPIHRGGLEEPDGTYPPVVAPIVWRSRKCRRVENERMPDARRGAMANDGWRCHFRAWAGKQARRDERGWVCPHRHVSLADRPVKDGVVECPLHLLRLDAATGVVLNELGATPPVGS